MSKLNYKEFRCGNLVEFQGKVYPLQIVCEEYPFLDTPEFGVGVVTWNNMNRIPLTKEWLLKCGIEIFGNTSLCLIGDKKFHLHFHEKTGGYRVYIPHKSIEVKYLHQFQNFYFLFYNEELQINIANNM